MSLLYIARNGTISSADPSGWMHSGSYPFLAVSSANVWLAFQRLRGLEAWLKTAHSTIRHDPTFPIEECLRIQSNLNKTMAFRAPPSFCADAAYEKFLPLRGFSPAKSFCSNLAIHQSSDEIAAHSDSGDSFPITASPHSKRDIQCPAGSILCSLLSELQAADKTVARNVWYLTPLARRARMLCLHAY